MMDDGEIVLSPGTIGGVVDLRWAKDLGDAVQQYNKRYADSKYPEELTVVNMENLETVCNQIRAY
jgi:hypothetical protein